MHPHKHDLFTLPEHSKKVFDGVRWKVHQWEQELFDGTKRTFETVERMDTVAIIPVLPDGNIVIEKEIQPYWKSEGINLIAGGVENEEDIFVAARRELEEEVGMVFSDYHLISIDEPMIGILWTSFTFIATGFKRKIPQRLDGGEKIEPKIVSPEELIKLTKTKSFKYSPRVIENYVIQDKVDEFLEMLKNPEKFSIKTEIK